MKQIAQGIAMLELTAQMGERQSVIHPTLLWDDEQAILVDAGLPGMLSQIREEMHRAGVPFDHLSKVVLTHQDTDHIGGVSELLAASEHAIEIVAHELDKPYIEGDKMLIKFNPSRGTPPSAKVDAIVSDGNVLPYFGGVTIIFTPGHTPGHISLYHKASKTLITGDAIVSNGEGELTGPNEAYTPDLEEAWRSITKFTQYDIRTAICYHGGICEKNVNAQFAALAQKHA